MFLYLLPFLLLIISFDSFSAADEDKLPKPTFSVSLELGKKVLRGRGALSIKELGSALSDHNDLHGIILKRADLEGEVVKLIASFLGQSTHLEVLDLSENSIGAIESQALGTALVSNTSLKVLDLSSNACFSDDLFREIGIALSKRTVPLDFLNMDENPVQRQSQEDLNRFFSTRIGYLGLARVHISSIIDALCSQTGKGTLNGLRICCGDYDFSQIFSTKYSERVKIDGKEVDAPKDLMGSARDYGVKFLYLDKRWVAKADQIDTKLMWRISQEKPDPLSLKAFPLLTDSQVADLSASLSPASSKSPKLLSRRTMWESLQA